jgi:hypothetical protein
VIAFRVPRASCRGSALSVSIAPRQLQVACARTGEVWMHGELEQPVSPSSSTWHTDGTVVTLTLTKLNLQLHAGAGGGGGGGGGGARGAVQGREQTTHWERLFTTDEYVERGMVDADYSDLPAAARREERQLEERRKAGEEQARAANRCPLCGEDVRYFCDCRAQDDDYRRPLPEG